MGNAKNRKQRRERITLKMSREELEVILMVDAAEAKRENDRPTITMQAVKPA